MKASSVSAVALLVEWESRWWLRWARVLFFQQTFKYWDSCFLRGKVSLQRRILRLWVLNLLLVALEVTPRRLLALAGKMRMATIPWYYWTCLQNCSISRNRLCIINWSSFLLTIHLLKSSNFLLKVCNKRFIAGRRVDDLSYVHLKTVRRTQGVVNVPIGRWWICWKRTVSFLQLLSIGHGTLQPRIALYGVWAALLSIKNQTKLPRPLFWLNIQHDPEIIYSILIR
jgi:hypothetical protein